MTTLVANDCIECNLRLANDLNPICDGTGVISVSDIGESRVLVCPCWPCDEDEPLAYWQAQEGLGYDIPPSLQQRIHANVMAEIRSQKVESALVAPQRTTSARVSRGFLIAVAVCIPVWIGLGALLAWLA